MSNNHMANQDDPPANQCLCAICKGCLSDGRDTVYLKEKGAAGINAASVERCTPSITVSAGQIVHVEFRRYGALTMDLAAILDVC